MFYRSVVEFRDRKREQSMLKACEDQTGCKQYAYEEKMTVLTSISILDGKSGFEEDSRLTNKLIVVCLGSRLEGKDGSESNISGTRERNDNVEDNTRLPHGLTSNVGSEFGPELSEHGDEQVKS